MAVLFNWLCSLEVRVKWEITVVFARLPLSPFRLPSGFYVTEVLLVRKLLDKFCKLAADLFKADLFLLFYSFSRFCSGRVVHVHKFKQLARVVAYICQQGLHVHLVTPLKAFISRLVLPLGCFYLLKVVKLIISFLAKFSSKPL